MRAGANWVQHTLTPAVQSVLKHAIAEARRRGHAQVQPLHVAAMLLTHSESRLREAWMVAGPTPLRALEVCFNVALDHLAQSGPAAPSQPTLSNALVAALKRAHAHQRRGCCPEQQQPPLLAVKVELEQLIISVLDDPSVSRVIKEAGSSSAHIKGNLEDNNNNPLISLIPSTTTGCLPCTSSLPGLRPTGKPCSKLESSSLSMNGFTSFRAVSSPQSTTCFTSFRPGANSSLSICEQMESEDTSTQTELLMGSSSVKLQEPVKACDKTILGLQLSNPEVDSQVHPVQQQKMMPEKTMPDEPGVEIGGKENDICRLMEILLRPMKRNALLVVDSDSSDCASAIMKDLALRIKKGQVPEQLRRLQVLVPQLSSSSFALCSQFEIEQKLGELSRIVDECMPEGAVLHLGDLEWLSDPVHVKMGTVSFCPAQHAVEELERLLLRHAGSRLWFVGVATQQVFARCQARHPKLEGQWGLQPLQLASSVYLSSCASQQLEKLVNEPGSASEGLYPLNGKTPNQGPTVKPFCGDGEVGDKLQCCTECLAKFEQERHLIHEHERLSLHLAPAEWCSLSSGDAPNEGRLDTHSSQVKSQSVIQKLKELQRKWQGTCQSVHAHLHAPVSSTLKSEPSPLSQKLANGSMVDGKTNRLGSITFPPCAIQQGNSVGSPLSKKQSQVPLTLPHWAQSSSCRVNTVNPMAIVQADAPLCAKDKRDDAVCTSDICGPNNKGSVISASAEQDIMLGTSVTLAQNGASQMSVQTDLALGQPSALVVSGCSVSLQNATGSGKPLQRRPQWQVHQERMQERIGNASPLRGFPWQVASSKATQPKALVTNTPAPGINQGPLSAIQERIVDIKGLLSRVGWQREAVEAIASTVTNCRSGMGWTRGAVPRIDSWLLLLGPDPVAKRLIAKALAEMVAGSEENLVFLCFGDQAVSNLEMDRNGIRRRGRSPLDRLVEAVRMKPVSVLLLEDIDKADCVVRGSLLRAMERGKMADSSGREVSFSNVIVLMTSSIGAEDLVPEQSLGGLKFLEEKLVDLGVGTMRLRVEDTHSNKVIFQSQNNTVVVEHEAELPDTDEANGEQVHPMNGFLKRKVDWPFLRQPEQRVQLKRPKLSFSQRQALVLDLNLLAEENEDSFSNAPTGQSQKACRCNQEEDEKKTDEDMTRDRVLGCARDRLSDKFCELLDFTVVLKPFDFSGVASRALAQLTKAFEGITTQGASLEVDVTVLEHILAVIWWGSTVFDTWLADVLGKSVTAVLTDVSIAENTVVKLVGNSQHGCRRENTTRESMLSGPQLPLSIEISQRT